MKYLTRMLALPRLLQLKRQWKRVAAVLRLLSGDDEQLLAALVFGEVQRSSHHPLPQFYASKSVATYSPWGDASAIAFERIFAEDNKGRMQGLATWLTVVFHETANSPIGAGRRLHRDVAYEVEKYRSLRERLLAIRSAA